MRCTLALAVFGVLIAGNPAGATSLQIYEDSMGALGTTAVFQPGLGHVADLDLNASTAEGGGLSFGATEITIIPLGDVSFTSFSCSFAECSVNFTPGGEGTGLLVIDDTGTNRNGLLHLGDLNFDLASAVGSIELTGCNYTDAGGNDRSCAAFTLVTAPEPGTGSLLALGLASLLIGRRRGRRLAALLLPLGLGLGLTVAPAASQAASLQIWENTLGAPGNTATFSNGAGLNADLDLDAASAEGGGLLVGASEIELRPSGSVSFVGFSCAVAGCLVDFVPGGDGDDAVLRLTDPDPQPQGGVIDLGNLTFDAPTSGGIHLVDCHYIGQDETERQCNSFQVVTLPEPGGLLLLAAGAALLFGPLRRRR